MVTSLTWILATAVHPDEAGDEEDENDEEDDEEEEKDEPPRHR